MPGIVGIIAREPSPEYSRLAADMASSLCHENFHVSGTYSAPELGVYCGWAAFKEEVADSVVIDRHVRLFLSGECFPNDASTALPEPSQKQTPMVGLYHNRGRAFLDELNGIFSGLLIDERSKTSYLFNDRYGLERIYCHYGKDAFYFASEAKALLRVLPELRKFDDEGVRDFLNFGCTVENRTLFKGVELLPGGSVWTFANQQQSYRKYFSPEHWEAQPSLSAEAFESEFEKALERIVPRYWSRRRVAISLTAGLDSRMVLAFRPSVHDSEFCYTFAGPVGTPLDAAISAQLAQLCGLKHETIRLKPDFFANFADHVDETVYATDGCFGVLGSHEIYLNRQTRNLGSARLTGNYGSEIFRGVSTLKRTRLAPQLFGDAVQPQQSDIEPAFAGNPVTFAAFNEVPWNLFGSFAASRSQVRFRTPYLDNDLVRLGYQAPRQLGGSSRVAATAVSRGDPALSAVPTDMADLGDGSEASRLLRKFYAKLTFKLDYINNEGMPGWASRFDSTIQTLLGQLGMVGRHKFLRYRQWFRSELSDYLRQSMQRVCESNSSLWNKKFLRALPEAHLAGSANYLAEINSVLTLDAVERLLFGSHR